MQGQQSPKVPWRMWPTNLNFILPSTTWVSTVADIILGTRGRALRSGPTPAPQRQASREARNGSPLGRSCLASSSDPCSAQEWPPGAATVPGCVGLGFAQPDDSSISPWGGGPRGTGLWGSSPSHTWLTFWSRCHSWFGSNSGPAGKLLPGLWLKETWPDLDPTPGRTLNLQSPHPRGSRGLSLILLKEGKRPGRLALPPGAGGQPVPDHPGLGVERGGPIPLTGGGRCKCLLSERLREQRGQRGASASFVHASPEPGQRTLYPRGLRPWERPHPRLLTSDEQVLQGAQALGKSHCWPVFW